jgi:hypothetical protein
MVIEQTQLSKLSKNLNAEEQNLLHVINKSIMNDKTKLAKLYNIKNANNIDKAYLKAISGNFDLLGGGGASSHHHHHIPHPNSSSSPYVFKPAHLQGGTARSKDHNLTATYKLIDDVSQRNLLSRSLLLREELNQNGRDSYNGTSINKIKLRSSSQKRNSSSFNNGGYGSSSRVDPLHNLFVRSNNLESATLGNNLNSLVRKNSLKLNREKSMATDYYTFMSTQNNKDYNNIFVENSTQAFKAGSNNTGGSILKSSNNQSNSSPVDQQNQQQRVSFDNVFSNLNLIYPVSTPTFKNQNPSESATKPGTGNKSMSNKEGSLLKKQPSQSQSLLSSKLNVNKMEDEMAKQQYRKSNNLLGMLTSIEKLSENDEKTGGGGNTVTYLIPNKPLNEANLATNFIANHSTNFKTNAYRPSSRGGSYKSRDVNDSYAYTDVKKYIEENELMSPEKERSIDSWVGQVNSQREFWEKNLIEIKIEAH